MLLWICVFIGLSDININSSEVTRDFLVIPKKLNFKRNKDVSFSSYLRDEDKYEPNNNISDSTKLCVDDFYIKDTYNEEINATLDYIGMIQDIDYYYFTLFTDSNVTINVDAYINYQGNFQFALCSYDYYQIKDKCAYHTPKDIIYDYDGTRHIEFSNLLSPGTYFIYMRGCQNQNITNVLPYKVFINVSKTMVTNKIVYVYDLLAEEDNLGAVWISDYIPGNTLSFFDFNSDILYYKANETNLGDPDFALDKLREVSNGKPIRVCNYYIWDNTLRLTLHHIFAETKNYFIEHIENKYNSNVKFRVRQNDITKSLEIVASVLGNDLMPRAIAIPANIISKIGVSVINNYYNLIINEIDPNDIYLSTYLGMLTASFDVALDTNLKLKPTFENKVKYGIKEIISIPIYYSLGVNKSVFPNLDEHYFSFKVTNQMNANEDSLKYTEKFINTMQENSNYINGKVYKIKQFGDMFDFSELEMAEFHEHVYNARYESEDKKTHLAYCRCDEAILQNHFVKRNSSVCMFCNAVVDLGFIEYNAKLLNGYYKYRNGVM